MVDLSRANELMAALAQQDDRFSPISISDLDLFEKFFPLEEHTYGSSWTYVTQGMYGIGPNKLGYKFYDGKNLSGVEMYPKLEDTSTIMLYWVRPMGPEIIDIIIEIGQKVAAEMDVYTYVKKAFPQQYEQLLSKGYHSAEKFPWHSLSHSEDDTYPELIYSPKFTLEQIELVGRKKNLRKTYLETKKLAEVHKIELIEDNFQEVAWKVVNHYFENRDPSKHKLNVSTPFDYYNMIFNNPARPELTQKLVYVDGKPEGFYVVETTDKNKYANIYGLIINRYDYKYLADFVVVNIMETTTSEFINIGGSEDDGIHNFKLKYRPVEENQMYWVTNYPV